MKAGKQQRTAAFAAFVVLHLVASVSHAAILDQDETPDPQRVEDELTATVVRYLTG